VRAGPRETASKAWRTPGKRREEKRYSVKKKFPCHTPHHTVILVSVATMGALLTGWGWPFAGIERGGKGLDLFGTQILHCM
jgi:hypothetical protein